MGLRRTPPAIAVLCILTLSHGCSYSVDCTFRHSQHLSSSSNVINSNLETDSMISDHSASVDLDITSHTGYSVVSADGQQPQQHASQLHRPILTFAQLSSLARWLCRHLPNAVSGYICPAVPAKHSASLANQMRPQVGHCCIIMFLW